MSYIIRCPHCSRAFNVRNDDADAILRCPACKETFSAAGIEKVAAAPSASDAPSPPLEIYIDPGDASKETLQELFESLSELHIVAGGEGLEFRPDGTFMVEVAEVPS